MRPPSPLHWDDAAQAYVPAAGAMSPTPYSEQQAAQRASDDEALGITRLPPKHLPPSDPFAGQVQDPFRQPALANVDLAAALLGRPIPHAERLAMAKAQVEVWTKRVTEMECSGEVGEPDAS